MPQSTRVQPPSPLCVANLALLRADGPDADQEAEKKRQQELQVQKQAVDSIADEAQLLAVRNPFCLRQRSRHPHGLMRTLPGVDPHQRMPPAQA